jgi:hypothetical protein
VFKFSNRIAKLLVYWLRVRAPDFFSPLAAEFLEEFRGWLRSRTARYLYLSEVTSELEAAERSHRQVLFPSLDAAPGGSQKMFLEVPAEKIAGELTSLEMTMFCSIDLQELHRMAWMGRTKATAAPNVIAFARWSNRVNLWLQSVIVNAVAADRLRTIEHVLQIAQFLLQQNNFTGVQEVVGALQGAAVFRLRKTFSTLPQEAKNNSRDALALMNPTGAYSSYRRKAHSLSTPYVPYIGVFLTDLIGQFEGNSDDVPNHPGQINFRLKYRSLANRFRHFVELQKADAIQPPDVALRGWLMTEVMAKDVDEEQLYEASLLVEPRE